MLQPGDVIGRKTVPSCFLVAANALVRIENVKNKLEGVCRQLQKQSKAIEVCFLLAHLDALSPVCSTPHPLIFHQAEPNRFTVKTERKVLVLLLSPNTRPKTKCSAFATSLIQRSPASCSVPAVGQIQRGSLSCVLVSKLPEMVVHTKQGGSSPLRSTD